MQKNTEMSEEELSDLCRQGDNRARRELYERYSGALMAVCLRYVADRETAEDVLHDGFIRIFQSMNRFTYIGEGSLKAWLSRVMANEALGYLRKHNARMQQEIDTDDIPDMPDEDEDVDDIPQSVLMELIRQLPDGYRAVFNLYAIEGKSHKEIAELLGIKPDTSASQYHRAKAMLARLLSKRKKETQ